MFRYCGLISISSSALGSAADHLAGGALEQFDVVHRACPRRKSRRIARNCALPGDPVELVGMDEPFAARGRLRREGVGGQRGDDPGGEAQRVDELAGRLPGVDVDTGDSDDASRRRTFVLQLADLGAVDRVGAERAKALEIEQRRALADLLVGRERRRAASVAAARGARRGAPPRS